MVSTAILVAANDEPQITTSAASRIQSVAVRFGLSSPRAPLK
jgi:hypothetical protein